MSIPCASLKTISCTPGVATHWVNLALIGISPIKILTLLSMSCWRNPQVVTSQRPRALPVVAQCINLLRESVIMQVNILVRRNQLWNNNLKMAKRQSLSHSQRNQREAFKWILSKLLRHIRLLKRTLLGFQRSWTPLKVRLILLIADHSIHLRLLRSLIVIWLKRIFEEVTQIITF